MKTVLCMAAALVALCWTGCGSSGGTANLSADERFEKAKALFDDEDYLEAINEFTVITLQHQGSGYADDAQFYLGECRFQRGEYLLAAFEYGELLRKMPASPFRADAQYKLGLSYYSLSPKSALDQQYTKKAIEEFQTFVEYFPANDRAPEAEAKIKELNNRLAKKQYDTAQLYSTMEYYKAAIFYFDDVIEKFHDTEYASLAYLGKVEALIARKKFREAETEINEFIQRFPNNVLRSRADKLKESIDRQLNKDSTATGRDSGVTGGQRLDLDSLSQERP